MQAATDHFDYHQGERKDSLSDGSETYRFESGTRYEGKLKDGLFQGKGILHFPCGGRYESTWENGKDQGGVYIFEDGLKFEDDDAALTGWRYCNRVWDRRFYQEILEGLQPVNRTPLAARSDRSGKPSHEIPEGCYDVGDGYYNPQERLVYSYLEEERKESTNASNPWSFLRNVTGDEHEWILSKCRRGSDEVAGCLQVSDYSDVLTLRQQAGRRALSKLGSFSATSDQRQDFNAILVPPALLPREADKAAESWGEESKQSVALELER